MSQLVKYDEARRALEEAHRIDEVKDIRDKAEAIRQYARQAKDNEMTFWAADIKLRAERKGGQLLKQMEDSGERATAGNNQWSSQVATTLSDLGIGKDESSRWQQEAELPDDEFEKWMADNKERGTVPTSLGLRTVINKKKRRETQITTTLPAETYRCIVVDPPWPIEKVEREKRPNQAGFDYPTMSIDEIKAFGVPDISADDAHLFLWTTHRFLPVSFDVLKAWDYRYVCCMVWHKPGGFQPFGLPQYNCEFVLYARHGSPEFVDTKAFNTCFSAPRLEHSRKPSEFYDVIRRVTGGPRIDVFSRSEHEGFFAYGNETGKFQK